jgi:hypothetical protein
LLWKRIMGTQVLRVLEPADVVGATTGASNNGTGPAVEAETDTDPGHGICSQNPTPCGCLRVYVHASPKAPPGQRLTVCVINLGSTSQDVRGFSRHYFLANPQQRCRPLLHPSICVAVSSRQHADPVLAGNTCDMFHGGTNCRRSLWCPLRQTAPRRLACSRAKTLRTSSATSARTNHLYVARFMLH